MNKPGTVSKPILEYLEYQVCDHCNLNCKGCTHYCNISEEGFADLDSYIRDLERLKELFRGIEKIRLMGGEPLLNRELPDFIKVTRRVFPEADIRIVTNGLLIPGMGTELAEAMQSTNSSFDITLYPPTATILDSVTKILLEYGIKSTISKSIITNFIKFKTLRPVNNPEKSAKGCRARKCYFLRDGCLAKCSEPILAEKLNKRFFTDFYSNDIYNIYDDEIDGWKLKKQLAAPIDFCRYCVPYPEKFCWEPCQPSRAKLEDWIVLPRKVLYLNCLYLCRGIMRTAFRELSSQMPCVATAIKKLLHR